MGIPFKKDKRGGTSTPDATNSARPATAPVSDGEAALDTLGAILRAFGTSAFDVGELDESSVRRRFERWSQHALVAAPLDPDAPKDQAVRRDWSALRQLVVSHRKKEAEYVVTSLTNFRSAVLSFVEIVNRAASQDKQEGVLANERLTSLRAALQCTDIETLRREVSQTATALESALAEQQKKQEQRLAEFASSVRSLGEQLESAKREGALDPLTRLPNRLCFDEFVAQTVKLASLVGRSVALFMVDIDKFKSINDAYGHPVGDEAIKAVANCLVRRFPRRGDLVARYGGDEFAIVLGDIAPSDARTLAQRLVESVRATTIMHQDQKVILTLSVGISFFEHGDTPQAWLARADAALYQAKAGGRDRWMEAATR